MLSMRIEQLSEQTLGKALEVLHKAYPVLLEEEHPDIVLPASVNLRQYKQQLDSWDVREPRYWVSLEDDQVIGIIGLYAYGRDQAEAVWIGWYGVSPGHRGTGTGRELLDFAIAQARTTGKRYLRLYTSTDPNEARSHEMYERRGFVKIREEPLEGTPFKYLYLQLDLQTT